MKATLEFDLDEYSDKLAHKRAINATNTYIALHEIDDELRQMTKYDNVIGSGQKIALPEGYHTVTEKEALLLHEVVSGIRFKISSILEDNGINMGDLE